MTETLVCPLSPTPRVEAASRPRPAEDTVACPECGQPATVEWRTQIGSTCGLLQHVEISCIDRHRFFLPTYMLAGRCCQATMDS